MIWRVILFWLVSVTLVSADLPRHISFDSVACRGSAPQYDANGNLTNDGTRVFSYDAENQLTNIFVTNTWQVGFVYDGLNRRTPPSQQAQSPPAPAPAPTAQSEMAASDPEFSGLGNNPYAGMPHPGAGQQAADATQQMLSDAGQGLAQAAMMVPLGPEEGAYAAADEALQAERAAKAAKAAKAKKCVISPKALKHIGDRHGPLSAALNAGKFAPGTTDADIANMINQAVENATPIPNTLGRPGQIFDYDTGATIGTDINGNSTSSIRIVVSPSGQVITAFPR